MSIRINNQNVAKVADVQIVTQGSGITITGGTISSYYPNKKDNTPLYTWKGTQAEYDAGDGTTQIYFAYESPNNTYYVKDAVPTVNSVVYERPHVETELNIDSVGNNNITIEGVVYSYVSRDNIATTKNIGELHPDWICDITDSYEAATYQAYTMLQTDALLNAKMNNNVPHIIDTYDGSTSWYRIYSDGWCEQGGTWRTASAAYNAYAVTLLKKYRDINYIANVTASFSNSDLWPPRIGGKTVNSIQFYYVYNSVGVANWEAKGYLAEGEYNVTTTDSNGSNSDAF